MCIEQILNELGTIFALCRAASMFEGGEFTGVVDLLNMKAWRGQTTSGDIRRNLRTRQRGRFLIEAAAGSDDALGSISRLASFPGLRSAGRARHLAAR